MSSSPRKRGPSRATRTLPLAKANTERRITRTDDQIQPLERFTPEVRERHIEVPRTGALVAVDTVFVSILKGIGKVHLQTAIDHLSRHAWAARYANKLPVTALQLLNNDVLPSFEQHNATV